MVGDVEAHEIEVDTEREADVPEGTEVSTDFIPGGSMMDFLPGGDDTHMGIPGKTIDNGKYIGLVRIWAGDRRLDIRFRITDDELEEKREYYFQGDMFFTDDWKESVASWYQKRVQLPEGANHTLRSYIELYLEGWTYDEIGERWWFKYEDHY